MNYFVASQKTEPPGSINQKSDPPWGYNSPHEIRIILIQITPFVNGVTSVFLIENSGNFPFVVYR